MEIDGHGVFTSLLIEALKGALPTSLAELTLTAFIHMSTKPSALGTSALFSRPMSQVHIYPRCRPQVGIGTIRKLCKYFPEPGRRMELDPSFEPTNSPDDKHEVIERYAVPTANTEIF
ncbi:MAG: hypothetical protein ACLT98_09365 [Eggerthellaceae bacterium]